MPFVKEKNGWSLLQFIGAACLIVVVLAHVAEGLRLFPSMRWGLPHSVSHFIDLWSAIFGVTLFSTGVAELIAHGSGSKVYTEG